MSLMKGSTCIIMMFSHVVTSAETEQTRGILRVREHLYPYTIYIPSLLNGATTAKLLVQNQVAPIGVFLAWEEG